MCRHINPGFWRGLVGGGGPFWLHRETMTFICRAVYQNTGNLGVNKIPPKFDTLFAKSLYGVQPLKGLSAQRIYKYNNQHNKLLIQFMHF
jgi:hypothetical protein